MSRRKKREKCTGAGAKVVGYRRVSTDRQADSGAGMEVQKWAIEAECARRGWHLLCIEEDEGLSGKTMKRPGLQRAMSLLAKGRADILVAAKLDRLSRSVRDFCEITDRSCREGWTLVVLDFNVDTSTPGGELMAGVMVQFAQFERRIISQRTKDALAVKKSQGVVLGGRPEIPSNIERRITEARSQRKTMKQIADDLNAANVPTARGGAWHASTVKVVLDRAGIVARC